MMEETLQKSDAGRHHTLVFRAKSDQRYLCRVLVLLIVDRIVSATLQRPARLSEHSRT